MLLTGYCLLDGRKEAERERVPDARAIPEERADGVFRCRGVTLDGGGAGTDVDHVECGVMKGDRGRWAVELIAQMRREGI